MWHKELIPITVHTNARENRVEDQDSLATHQRMFRVWVTESPDRGRANEAVIDLIGHHLGIPPTQIEIIRGHRGHKKLLAINRSTH